MMTQSIDLTSVATSIIMLLIAVVTVYCVPYIKSKLSSEQLNTLYTWTFVAVKAAEQLCISGVIDRDKRKQYVLDFLKKRNLTIDLDEIDALIESFVKDLPPLIIKNEQANGKQETESVTTEEPVATEEDKKK